MAEPHRSILLGKFKTSFKDQPNQVIPTAWIKAAQSLDTGSLRPTCRCARSAWTAQAAAKTRWSSLARHDGWYDRMPVDRGQGNPDGQVRRVAAAASSSYRRDDALVVVDLGGGYGGPTYEHLKATASR
jgi:hypothetical protein